MDDTRIARIAESVARQSSRAEVSAFLRTGGSESFPIFNKETSVVTAKRIQNAMRRADYIMEMFDFSKVQFDTVDPAELLPGGFQKGVEAIWRVFPHGEFGNRKSDYVWGTVRVALASGNNGVEVLADIYVRV